LGFGGKMKALKILFLSIVLLTILGCSSKKGFNFKKDWTWEELYQSTEDAESQKFIKYIEKKLTIDEAYYVFRQLDKIKNPKDIYKLYDLEKYQRENGGQFYKIIPDFFKKREVVPIPDSFDHIVADVFYFTQIRDLANKNLYKAGIMYNLKFLNTEMTKIERKGSNLDLEINTKTIQNILDLYNKSKLSKKVIMEITNGKDIDNMLACRSKDSKFTEPIITSESYANFLETSTKSEPIYQLWNWMNPANNFGFAELNTNHENYQKLIDNIENNKQLFEDRILAKLDNFIPKDFHHIQKVDLAVNFGQKTWSSKEGIGANIVHIKDDFKSYTTSLRREVFLQILKKLGKETKTIEPNFENEKDNEYYKTLSFIYTEGLSNYIGGVPPHYDFSSKAKESNGALEQIQQYTYSDKKPQYLKSVKMFTMGENGLFSGLGFLMARTIDKQIGRDELIKCLQNGPVYFFKTYLNLQESRKTKKYFNFEQSIFDKIDEFYNLQAKNYVE